MHSATDILNEKINLIWQVKCDECVKLSFHKHMKKQEVELSSEIPPLTKEEVHRIKIKAQKRLNRH